MLQFEWFEEQDERRSKRQSETRANARDVQKLRKVRKQRIAKLEHKQRTLRHHCLRTIGFRCGWTLLNKRFTRSIQGFFCDLITSTGLAPILATSDTTLPMVAWSSQPLP